MNAKMPLVVFWVIIVFSCEKEGIFKEREYQFVKRYCATVTVGGVVGIQERCFEVGEVFTGYSKNDGTITIRIAGHNPVNDGPPSSASYQEFLDVPEEYLKLRQ